MQKIFLLLLLITSVLLARDKVHEEKGRGNFGVPLSLSMSNYQDLTASSMRYRGFGGTVGFEYTHYLSTNNELAGSFQGFLSYHHSTSNDVSEFLLVGGKGNLSYLHLFQLTEIFSFLVGSDIQWLWQVSNNENLINNSSNGMFENAFFLRVGGENRFGNNRPLRYTLGISLLGFVDRMAGFAFSDKQSTLEEGEFAYAGTYSLGYSDAQFYLISPSYFHLNVHLEYQFHRRWSVGYEWDVLKTSYKELGDYPLVIGTHNLAVTFLF